MANFQMLSLFAQKRLSVRFMALTLVMVGVGVSLFGWIMMRVLESEIRARASSEANSQVDHVFDNLITIDDLSSHAVRSAMNVLLQGAQRIGPATIRGSASIRGVSVPNLYLGSTSQVGNFILVDRVKETTGCTATLFVKSGRDYVRVSSNVLRSDGSRATGTILDPNGRALAAIGNGRSFYGVVDILGMPYMTGYEPMRDRFGRIIGILYVGYPLKSLADLGNHINDSKILDHGFVALRQPDGTIAFKSNNVEEQEVYRRLAQTSVNSWVIVSKPFEKWGYTLLAAYPQSDVSTRLKGVRLKAIFFIALLCFTVVFAQFLLIARLVVSPLQRLVSRMRDAGPKTSRREERKDEFGILAQGFDHFVREIEDRNAELFKANRKLELHSAVLGAAANSIMITDEGGEIVWTNPSFSALSGYSAEEVIGKNPRLLNSGKQDKSFYQHMWATIRSGKVWRGEIVNRRNDGSCYTEEMTITPVLSQSQKISHFVAIKQDITERKLTEERVQFLAYYDALTGLPNRTLLQDRVTKALGGARRQKDKVALLFFDLDRFKDINDSLGHSVGDLLLQQVAERLKTWGREQDTVARVGGDEFLILLTGLKDIADAAVAAKRIVGAMTTEFIVQGHALNVSCSIGVSIFPEHGADGETLIKNADAAMYSAKNNGRNNFRFFTQDMNAQVVERLTLESGLRLALEKKQLFLVYQPQMDIATRQIIGLEALLRWQHPELGLVPPDKFIRIAENSGLIVPIGEWVLRTACSQARKWQDEGVPAVTVAVNVSAIQFRQEGFCELVRSVLHETGLAPQYLELELTESLLLSNADVTFSVLQELEAMGLKLAIDDFGTGYSSLSYLKQFPVSKLKVDRSFIRDVAINPDDAAITTAIISMAKSLNLKVIAEGVEDEAQMTLLRAHHCDEIQGYYFSKPLAPEDAAVKLRGAAVHALSASHGTR
jgi:diguanylate cyclase (GGDEF)-like protein/PAS domain S-box-containing protein